MRQIKNLLKNFFFKIFWKKKLDSKKLNVFQVMNYIQKYLPQLKHSIEEGRYIRLIFFKLYEENSKLVYYFLDQFWGDIYEVTRPVDSAIPGKEYSQRKNEALQTISRIKSQMENCLGHRI
jgi:hypothetical protein